MPVSLAQIAANTAQVTIPVGEDTVTVTYYPGRVTERALAKLNAFAQMDASSLDSGLLAFNEELAHLIKSWDVYEDDAQTVMFPLEAKRLAELPLGFRVQVLGAIMGDLRPEAMAPQLSLNGAH